MLRRARAIVDGRYVHHADGPAPSPCAGPTGNIRFVRLRPHSFFELLRGKLADWYPVDARDPE
jgi:hypothetical protein